MSYLQELNETIRHLSTRGKGILAADESTQTITKRFQALGIGSNEETRRQYRQLLMTTPGCNQFIAGIILFEETLNQKTDEGVSFSEALKKIGILPGIKVDKGLTSLTNSLNESITQGLDGLAERLIEYKSKGACFAKWRAVYSISPHSPSELAITANAEVLARYAAICQGQGIVPIVEPEILIDGDHTLGRCEEVTAPVLLALFNALNRHKLSLEHIILKPSMVIDGKNCLQKASVEEVAQTTLRILLRTVPAAVPTINFLSGGQGPTDATAHLNAMNQTEKLPWNLSFSYARALQDDCMKTWLGQERNKEAAQQAFYRRAKLNSLAAIGKYAAYMEKDPEISYPEHHLAS